MKEWQENLIVILIVAFMIFGVYKFVLYPNNQLEAQTKINNYTLVNYTANGDTIAVYENIKSYNFYMTSIVVEFEDKKEIIVSGNYTLFDKSKR